MLYTIENEKIILKVDTYAAEMHYLVRRDDDYNYLWNGDKKYWGGRNPILFPQVSSTSNKINLINGKEYPMGNHGFARNSEFEFVSKTSNSLVLLLKDNEETFKQYPFSFKLYVTYKLKEDSVLINYEIKNTGSDDMPFGFGLHPAFNCRKDFIDSYIIFDDNIKLVLNEDLFKKYPTYFVNPTPKKAALFTNNHHLSLEFVDFKYLAVWSPFAPFVCIEPWMSEKPSDDVAFEKRKDIITLIPNDTYKLAYKINLLGKLN